jgi:glutamate--cysteine ligase
MVPHLVTALSGPINELEQRVLDTMPAIERWFRLEWMEHTPLFYSAVDVRNAGFKLAPVDTNFHPGCWNNLTPKMLPLAIQAAMAAIEKICPEARNLLIVPENTTHHSSYFSSIAQLSKIFHLAGLHVRVGSINPALKKTTVIELPDGESVTLEPIIRNKRRLELKDFAPCVILLNNDLHAGVPGILEDLHEQYLLPPLHASWITRRQSQHFKCYEEVAKRLGKLLGIDPWLINPMFETCEPVNLTKPQDMAQLSASVNALLTKIRRKYKEYGIKEKPFVMVKADNGSHAMGIVTVRDTKDLDTLGQRMQNRAKTAAPSTQGILVQEGVPTKERIHEAVAEPVVYMMDRYVVGGFYRVHPGRGADENLNTPGSSYVPLAFEQSQRLPQADAKPGASSPNRFYMYGVISRLAMLAGSYELEATDPNAESYD